MSEMKPAAVVVGVGPRAGLGAALCRRFAAGGLHAFVAGRSEEKLAEVVAEIASHGHEATAVVTDTTDEQHVRRLFERAGERARPLAGVLYNAGNNRFGNFAEMEASFFEEVWRLCCFGGFLVGREAARRMTPQGHGTVIFTGATASVRGKPPFSAFAAAKAGLRSVAQSMAREFGPAGIHVAHVIIDGGIDGDKIQHNFPEFAKAKGAHGLLGLDAIAETYWQLHRQDKTAWTFELDVRPFKEPF